MTDHYFSHAPQAAHRRREIRFECEDKKFVFESDSSVFSKDHVDEGSELLIKTVLEAERKSENQRLEQEHVFKGLDLGTGYGVVGIVLGDILNIHMTLTDVNERALELARNNARRQGIEQTTTVRQSAGFENITESFDLIVTNPPIRAGKQIIHKMWEDAVQHLNDNGRLYIVIRKQQGAPSALTKLQTLSSDVEVLVKRKGFWVIRLIKAPVH